MTNAEARFNNSLRPRKPEGSLGRTAQDVHLDSHTAPELCYNVSLPTTSYACHCEHLIQVYLFDDPRKIVLLYVGMLSLIELFKPNKITS